MAAAELDLVAPFEDLNIDARPWYNDYQNKLPSEERKWHGFHCEGEGDPTERFNAHCVGPPLNNEEVQQVLERLSSMQNEPDKYNVFQEVLSASASQEFRDFLQAHAAQDVTVGSIDDVSVVALSLYFAIHRRLLAFLHVPKSAGTFVTNFFKENNVMVGRLETRFNTEQQSEWHMPPWMYPRWVLDGFIFLVVERDLQSRMLSELECRWGGWGDKKEVDKKGLFKDTTTEDDLRDLVKHSRRRIQ